jgi:hypothetical protein
VKCDETKKKKNKFNNSPPWRVLFSRWGRAPFIRHPEPSLFEGVRISSFKALELRNRGTEKDEILTSSGRRHRTPQNDKVDGRDCHVVQPKIG